MHSTDYGGAYRDSITCICFDICSSRLSLFILCPNGRTYILKLSLIFVWNRSTLPIRDEDFQSKFIITSYDVYQGEIDQTLPINGDSTGNNAFNDEDFDLDDINDDE
ncbi:unnamed protein product [Rotaria sordida]|uniref:Uncharacterized protein n=1 Tax=Rotaria sordida TaxID=392033 RepID=A0A819B935_9BILA|nr:unnamed protein product [Rotaria sordida]